MGQIGVNGVVERVKEESMRRQKSQRGVAEAVK